MNKNLQYPCISKFAEFVELKDFRPATKEEYVRYLRKCAEHFQCDPSTLCEDQVREYFLFLRQHKKYGGSTMNVAKVTLRTFFQDCLKVGADWTVFKDLQVRRPEPLPFVLSRDEVSALLNAIREPRFRTCLRLIYHCGLRVGETVLIEVRDIDGKGGRIHIRNGKGGKDRYVPLGEAMLEELRAWWRTHRNPKWLFPSPGRGWKDRSPTLSQSMRHATEPMSVSSIQLTFKLARERAGIKTVACVHTLRHSWATHMLEEGANIRELSSYLGHESLDTTAIYLHLTAVSAEKTKRALAALHTAVTPH